MVNLHSYDHIIVAFSGGKDSLACFLHLVDLGVDINKVELWHHDIDGREGSKLMDWPVTRDYCKKFAGAFGVPIYYSWKVGGFEGEMLRKDSYTNSTKFETPEGEVIEVGGNRGKKNTRLMFPQKAADLKTRWCSGYLKIDVADKAINNQNRFLGKRTLFITGERAQESPNRARYNEFEPHRTHSEKRHVDHWRPVLRWDETQVWEIIERYEINPHPAYHLGWGRVSCAACIFGSKNQWASLQVIAPEMVDIIDTYENSFGKTIDRVLPVKEMAALGTPYDSITGYWVEQALSEEFTAGIITVVWKLPAGAYGESCGPI